jgi:hypothetical protein
VERLEVLKEILTQLEKLDLNDLLKVVDEFGFSVRARSSKLGLCVELKTEAGRLYQQNSDKLDKLNRFVKTLGN